MARFSGSGAKLPALFFCAARAPFSRAFTS